MELISPELITQIGFPIAVTIYLLYERKQFNENITLKLERIAELLNRLEDKIDGKL